MEELFLIIAITSFISILFITSWNLMTPSLYNILLRIVLFIFLAISLSQANKYEDLRVDECYKKGGIVFPNSRKCTMIPNTTQIIYIDSNNNS